MGVKRRPPTQCKHCLTAVLLYVCMFESSIEKARLNGLVGEGAGFKVGSTWENGLYVPSRECGNF